MITSPRWQPTPRQKRYQHAIRQVGCVVTGQQAAIEMHHVVGASFRHNKEWIGQDFVLMLRLDLHRRFPKGGVDVSTQKHAFESRYGKQLELYQKQNFMLVEMVRRGLIRFDLNDMPSPNAVAAIEDLCQTYT